MALHLYRRHRRKCQGGHPEDSWSGEFEEHKKGWKPCLCPVLVVGTLSGHFRRKSTDTTAWTEARAVADRYAQADAWTGTPTPPPCVLAPPAPARPAPTTLDEICTLYLAHQESRGVSPATHRKYRTFTTKLKTFAASKGYVLVDQFTLSDVDLFWATWRQGPRAKAKRLTTLRGFFRFCKHRKWIAESPVPEDLRPPVGASKARNKAPFTDDELRRIIAACDAVRVEWKNETGTGLWTGDHVKDLVWLMLYTGYRISDATLFDMARVDGNDIFIRAKKNGGDVFAYIPDWLRDRLHARAARCGRRPFIIQSDRLETVTNVWRRRLARVFAQAGPFEEPPTPHRFRHTFARILLQRGVPVADVADLMGDDEETIRRHYARWVPERQARLTKILQEAFADSRR